MGSRHSTSTPLHQEISELDEILSIFWLYKKEQRKVGLYWGKFIDVCEECVGLLHSLLTPSTTTTTDGTPPREEATDPAEDTHHLRELIGRLFELLQRDTVRIGNESRRKGVTSTRPIRAGSNFVLNNLFMKIVQNHLREGTIEEFRRDGRDDYGKRRSYGTHMVAGSPYLVGGGGSRGFHMHSS